MHHYPLGLVTIKRNLAKRIDVLVSVLSPQTFLRDISARILWILRIIKYDISHLFLRNSRKNYIFQFVMFDASSIAKDAAQTTIPYIDAQNVSPVSGVWITGIGLYHKGYVGYGGYVGFMTKTFSFSTIDCEKVHSTLTAKK